MSQFEYTLPSGSNFRVNGPAGATQLQADQVFYEQVVAGSLVGYQPGQTLTSVASQITKFELSRLDRGTAGVDTVSVLSVIQNSPVISGIPNLVNVPIQNPVDQAGVVLSRGDTLGADPVGPLTAFQTQLLLAQLQSLVDQPFDVITQQKGIGKFGFNCYQLEQAGYVKPGTSARFLENPDDFVSVMNSPGIWTGLNGVDSLDFLLGDQNLQTQVQTQLMQQSYQALNASGVISQVPTSAVRVSSGQVYTATGNQTLSALSLVGGNLNLITGTSAKITNVINGDIGALLANGGKFGSVATAAWAQSSRLFVNAQGQLSSAITGIGNSLTTLPNLTGNLGSLGQLSQLNVSQALQDVYGKAAQFSLNFSTGNFFSGGGDLISGTQLAAGFKNTVNRATVDSAVGRILGNSKIPAPSFMPALPGAGLDIPQAENILKSVQGRIGGIGSQVTNLTSQARNLIAQAQPTFNRITG
jgi:hypothetical protein